MALDVLHLPVTTGDSDVQIFVGNSQTAGASWQFWEKPRGKSMVSIVLLGKGGNGGLGAVGANSTAAGGGGGGSGSETSITIPLALLPDQLFISLAGQSQTNTLASYICVNTPAAISPWNNVLLVANGGGNGGNAAGATPGAAGAAGAVATAATMPFGWRFGDYTQLAGAAGIIGGAAVSGANFTLPITGIRLCGGSGGGGLPAAAAAGTLGGSYTITAATIGFPPHNAPAATAVATTPPGNGNSGYQPFTGYFYGGTGGGSTHGSATTTGLVGSVGGFGSYGCGGGGNGGSLTGTPVRVAGDVGLGGPALCIITCW
jgi:hypothetical protein